MYAKDIRRENLRALAKQLGGITQLAERLGKSQSQISQLIGKSPSKNIGDKIATQVETSFEKPHGWMDTLHNHIDETTTAYELFCNSAPHRPIPLLRWGANYHYQPFNLISQADKYETLIPGGAKLSGTAFAVQLADVKHGVFIHFDFPDNTLVIIDPNTKAFDNAYIIQRQETDLIVRQVKAEGQRFYLKPLTTEQTRLEPLPSEDSFGVLRQLMIDFTPEA